MKAFWQRRKKGAPPVQKIEVDKQEIALQKTQKEIAQQETTTLGQLGRAIRQSSIYFVIATIALIVASILLINRQDALADVVKLHADTNRFNISVLDLRQFEKDFQITQQATYLIKFDKEHEKAAAILESISSNSQLKKENEITISRLKNALTTYKRLFDGASSALQKRGLDDVSGTRKTLREIAIKLNDIVPKGSAIETSLLYLRGMAKDFIILEQPEAAAIYNKESAKFQQMIANSSLNPATKSGLADVTKQYIDEFNLYAKHTLDAKSKFEDTTVAAHASLYTLPKFQAKLIEREKNIFKQVLIILIITSIVLVTIFLVVLYQLRNAQKGANLTLEETLLAQKKAEDENEQLNNSVINILQTMQSLSQRDLTVKAPVTEDVIGTISDSVNALTDETAKVLFDVTDVANQVEQVSSKVKMQAGLVSETAESERENVLKMTNTISEATNTITEISALANSSNESAAKAAMATQDALITVSNTVDEMESIRETIAQTEKRIKRLGERSQEISGIVGLINTISERTHVLALNASMQAAVAGEAGRGFAVVAEEVQRLAESSRNATEQIETLVKNIQVDTSETINTVNQTIARVVQGSEQAEKAGEQMQQTRAITAELVAQVQDIAKAMESQKQVSDQLLSSVQKIGASTENTARQIDEQNKETNQLQEAAKKLVSSVSVFKLPQRTV